MMKDKIDIWRQRFPGVVQEGRSMVVCGDVVANGTMVHIIGIVIVGKHVKSNKFRCQKKGKKDKGDAIFETICLHRDTNILKNRRFVPAISSFVLNFCQILNFAGRNQLNNASVSSLLTTAPVKLPKCTALATDRMGLELSPQA